MTMVIEPVVLPLALVYQENGNLSPQLLKSITGGGRLLSVVADWFEVMRNEAKKESIHLLYTWGGDYRDYAGQNWLFHNRYSQVSFLTYALTPADRRKKWPRDAHNPTGPSYWVKKRLANGSYPATASVPGYSNHGLAIAVDVAVENLVHPGNPSYVTSIGSKEKTWLENNVHRFGFSYESTAEPWHIRYVVGDQCPPFINETH